MSILVVYAAALLCLVEAAPSASCQADTGAASHVTGGAALLQLGGVVGRRQTKPVEDTADAETKVSKGSPGDTADQEEKEEAPEAKADEVKEEEPPEVRAAEKEKKREVSASLPEDAADGAGEEEAPEAKADEVKQEEPPEKRGEEEEKKREAARSPEATADEEKKVLAGNNDDNFDMNNSTDNADDMNINTDNAGKRQDGGKKDEKDSLDFNNDNDDEGASKMTTVDNFDSGEGPIKTEAEKSAAVAGLKKQVGQAISEASSALKEASAGEQAIAHELAKLGTATAEEQKEIAETVKSEFKGVEDQVNVAQERMNKLQDKMKPSASYLGTSPHAWLLAAACSWGLRHL